MIAVVHDQVLGYGAMGLVAAGVALYAAGEQLARRWRR